MSLDHPYQELFRQLEDDYRRGIIPPEAASFRLLRAAENRDPAVRERALLLLLHPPMEDELGYHRQLFWRVRQWLRQGAALPPAVWEWLLDRLVFLQAGSGSRDEACPESAGLLNQVPRVVRRRISGQPLAADLFLRHWDGVGLLAPERAGRLLVKRRWRLLRTKLRRPRDGRLWAAPTLKDFTAFYRSPGLLRRSKTGKGRWLRVGRALVVRPGRVEDANRSHIPGRITDLKNMHWGGFGIRSRNYLEALLERQAAELREIRRLARAASRSSRRVVISCHNATLAAMGGWAFPDLDRQFPDSAAWFRFRASVLARLEQLGRGNSRFAESHRRLWPLWEERLVQPKRLQAGWEELVRRRLAGGPAGQTPAEDAGAAPAGRGLGCRHAALSQKLGCPGPLQPCQRLTPAGVEQWRQWRYHIWAPGLRMLQAMVETGSEMLARGEIPQLVLPWIDKFFISSQREQDTRYLPAIVDWLQSSGADPLILFWEDSVHRSKASFALALARINRKDWRGIGMFGPNPGERREALEIIRREHAATRLFALRPTSEEHNPMTLDQLVVERPRHFLKHYDSSWKDGQVALYTGTDVFPLLAIQCDPEALPCWISGHGNCWPFGAFVRAWLRRAVLGRDPAGSQTDCLVQAYQCWAALR